MTLKTSTRLAVIAALLTVAAAGCSRSTSGLRPWPPIIEPLVFEDGFDAGVTPQPFAGSKLDAFNVDTGEQYSGTASLRITVPDPGDPSGTYAGGAITADRARDLSGYDALTFWARATRTATLDVAGFGNDNTGTSKYEAKWNAIGLTTAWKKYVIPIPLPARLRDERGLFFFAEGPESGSGYEFWLDDIRFEKLGTITNPRPVMSTVTLNSVVGATATITGTRVLFDVGGTNQIVDHSPAYFTYASSNPAVATVADGVIRVVGGGSTTITAKLDTVAASGSVTVNAQAPPATPAPTPTVPAANVISLFSNAYTNVPVDTWSATWDQADVSDLRIAGNDTKLYTNLLFAGIEFTTNTIDASAMTHFHADVWAPTGTNFRLKLVDFGANGVFGGGDDREQELTFNAGSTPPFTTGTWIPLEIPLASFTGLTTRAHLAQIVLSGDARTVYLDNVYLHD